VLVESAPGAGTTMRVLFPVASVEAALERPAPRATPTSSAIPVARPVVLVVDDEATLRRAMERFLDRRGFEALTAGSAPEALALLDKRDWRVDLIVTDMVMPRMSGREFVRRIRAQDPEMPVLCISGHVAWQESDAAIPDAPWGPDLLLAKPFAFPEFLERVRDALGVRTVAP
jgi:DNA-binding response OmpR family regulator